MTRAKALAAVAVILGAGLVATGLVRRDHEARGVTGAKRSGLARAAEGLRRPAAPAFVVGRPRLLERGEARARFAPVLGRVVARSAPNAHAPAVVTLSPRTEEGTTNIVLVLGNVRAQGEWWNRVRLPVLPNGRQVAVKVQRPGIREQMVNDFEALEDIAEFLDQHTELGKRYEFCQLLEQFRRSLFQELDYRAVFGTIAKWATEIDDPAPVPELISRAFYAATSGRPARSVSCTMSG